MNSCCLGDYDPGYISPLTTKSLLKWGITFKGMYNIVKYVYLLFF